MLPAEAMRTQVAIIGGGPAGLLLSHILDRNGIDSVVLERQSWKHVLGRIRAGVLEPGTVDLLREIGLGGRMDREGHVLAGPLIAWSDHARFMVDTKKFTGKQMMAYGQSAVTEDVFSARRATSGLLIEQVSNIQLHELTSTRPFVTCVVDGQSCRIDCDYIAGCDGSHGVSRASIPASLQRVFERSYPIAWLGIMSETPPLPDLCWCCHERGFALASMRTSMLSRCYIQCGLDENVEDWSDDRFWDEFKARCPHDIADQIVPGPSVEKAIALLRSYVSEPMRYGRMFLAGDAAHVVPPIGAKGLNLAVGDVFYLSRALVEAYNTGSVHYLDSYSDVALRRVWSAERLSYWLTILLHGSPDESPFHRRIRQSQVEHLALSEHAQASLAEQLVGMPL
jgi:p-hydroxybenzoate 3-monooxygenase